MNKPTDFYNPVDADIRSHARITDAGHNTDMRDLPNISQLVADLELSNASAEDKASHAARMVECLLGYIAHARTDFAAAKVAQNWVRERLAR